MADLSELNVNNTDYTLKDAVARNNLRSTQTVSGNPLTLTDASETYAESLVVELEPVQDLHGQSAPYVGGAGKNKCPITTDTKTINNVTYTVEDNGTIGLNGTASGSYSQATLGTISLPAGSYIISDGLDVTRNGDYEFYIMGVSGASTQNRDNRPFTINSAITNLTVALYVKSGVNTNGKVLKPMIRLATETDPTFAPYSNICPITGYTECEVDDVGKNLFNPQYFLDRGATYSDGYYNGAYAFFKYGVDDFNDATSYKPNTRYVVSYNIYADANVNARVVIKHTDGTTTEASASATTDTRRTVVSTENKSVDKIYTIFSNSGNVHIKDMQIEEGSTATQYEPYHSSNATIQFGQTVYGGKVDFLTGVLTVTMAEVDLGTLTWYKDTTTRPVDGATIHAFYAGLSLMKQINNLTIANLYCSQYRADSVYNVDYGGVTTVKDGIVGGSDQSKRVWVYDSRYNDYTTTDFKTTMSGVRLVYELAEPFTIQLTPQELKLLKQYNNITTNGTTINLDYIPDNSIGDAVKASEEYTDRAVKGEIEKRLEMPWVKVIDNDTTIDFDDIPIEGPVEYAYVLADNEFFKHRFILLEVYEAPGGLIRSFVRASALLSIDTLLEFSGNDYGEMISFPKSGDTVEVFVGIVDDDGTYKFTISLESTGSTIYNDFRARARYVD